MADGVYSSALRMFGNGTLDWRNDTIKCFLVDAADYAVQLTTHDFVSDVTATPAATVAVSPAFTGKTNVGGVLDAADITFSSVSGDESEALIIWKDTGSHATSPLICYIDSATGLPVTPNGGDINVTWDDGANKILKI